MKKYHNHGRELLILGVHLASSGYPNVKYRIEDLKKKFPLCKEINFPMWREQDLGTSNRYSAFSGVARALGSHILSIVALAFVRKRSIVYIPYPAILICFAISFFPTFLRPKHLVIDMFISVYDSAVIDRELISENGIAAKFLLWFEGRAARTADVLITDTDLNSDYYADLLNVSRNKFEAIPLSTDERGLSINPKPTDDETIEIVFVGTLVPLHGIQTIVEAIELLASENNIHFTIVGDGQDRSGLATYANNNPKQVNWVQDWKNEVQISTYIASADICLGIFGKGGKAQRVCPFKIYLYMSNAKPVITADTKLMRSMFQGSGDNPLMLTAVEDSVALAEAIKEMAIDQKKRASLGGRARKFYCEEMSNDIGVSRLSDLLGLQLS